LPLQRLASPLLDRAGVRRRSQFTLQPGDLGLERRLPAAVLLPLTSQLGLDGLELLAQPVNFTIGALFDRAQVLRLGLPLLAHGLLGLPQPTPQGDELTLPVGRPLRGRIPLFLQVRELGALLVNQLVEVIQPGLGTVLRHLGLGRGAGCRLGLLAPLVRLAH